MALERGDFAELESAKEDFKKMYEYLGKINLTKSAFESNPCERD